MSIREIIDWSIAQADGDRTGTIVSPFYQFYADGDNYMWACDVDIGEPEVLKSVPVASNNKDIIYAQQGKSVALKRMNDGRWCITGLAKTCRGLGHVIYMNFADDLATVVGDEWTGHIIRRLTYGELGEFGGYGVLPYGTQGRFSAAGTLIELVEN